MNATLSAHSPKFASKLVTIDQLAAMPEPVAMGRVHRPVPHIKLVDAIRNEITNRGFEINRSQFALGAKGAALFGVMDLVDTHPGGHTADQLRGRGISFGFRSSTNQELAIKAVAGTRVFVCDNLALSGDLIAFNRKSTTMLDLGAVIAAGFDKFLQHTQTLDTQIERLESTSLSDGEAKQFVYDIFAAAIMPVRLFDDVNRFYFKPADDMIDCQPRSLWGLHNACTRAMKDLTPVRVFGATVMLGKVFGLVASGQPQLPVIDGELSEN